MNLEKDNEDFISPVMKRNEDFKNMNLAKVQTTFAILIIVCSETTATVLSAMITYLVQNPSRPQKLTSEIRSTLTKERVNNQDLILTHWLNEVLCKCNPVPSGLPHIVPLEDDTVMGQWLPGFVSVLSILPFPSERYQFDHP